MKKLFLFAIVVGCCFVACTDKPAAPTETPVAVYDFKKDTTVYSDEMKRYWLVTLKAGPDRTHDSASAAKIQAGHMANIQRLAGEGKLIMAGPMGYDGDLRGIFIMDCKDSAEVAQLVNTDTAVMTGRLKMDYYPWWCAKGKYIFK